MPEVFRRHSPAATASRPCKFPARVLIDYIEGGDSLDDLLEQYPTVTRKQVITFLEEASEKMLAPRNANYSCRLIIMSIAFDAT